MLLLQHSSTPVGIDRLLAFHLRVKISAIVIADHLLAFRQLAKSNSFYKKEKAHIIFDTARAISPASPPKIGATVLMNTIVTERATNG